MESHADLVYYKIDASVCGLRINDRVTPETIIGYDFLTHESVMANCSGIVYDIMVIGRDFSLVIAISPEMDSIIATSQSL